MYETRSDTAHSNGRVFFRAIERLKALAERTALTEQEFEDILFKTDATASDEAHKRQRRALASITRVTREQRIESLLTLIQENNIASLSELHERKQQLINALGSDTVRKQYGIDDSEISFGYEQSDFEVTDELDKFYEEYSPTLSLSLLVASLGIARKKRQEVNFVNDLERLQQVITHIESQCAQAASQAGLSGKKALAKHRDVLIEATVEYVADLYIHQDDTSQEPGRQLKYLQTIQGSEQSCQQAVTNDRSRKILSLLTNLLTHITIVGMLANAINQRKTGSWLFFTCSQATQQLEKIDHDIPSMVGVSV